MEFTKTNRGFNYSSMLDRYDQGYSIQKSSLATEDCIWLGINDPNPQIMASQAKSLGIQTTQNVGWISYPVPEIVSINTRMHLTREMVAELIPVLQKFVDTGEIQ